TIAAALLETKELRGIIGSINLSGSAQVIPATPSPKFIDSAITFRTASPALGDKARNLIEATSFTQTSSSLEAETHYDEKYAAPHMLTRDELTEQIQEYVDTFDLDVINSATVQSTNYDKLTNEWTVKFRTSAGQRTAVSKHLVQATGVSSQKPFIPDIADGHLYKGISMHSANYKNAAILKARGIESALIIGCANTAFDLLEDCHAAGIQTTMVVRSPTYIVPVDYVCDSRALGAYNIGVEAGDRMAMTLPTCIDGQLGRDLFAQFASHEPDRYAPLSAAGFPVLDSRNPECALMHNLVERAGGHYVDVDTTDLITQGAVGVKADVEPCAYTETRLCFSDDSTADADAVVWFTGFADKDVNVLGPRAIAARLDPTWMLDNEGEIRGMWKRHLHVDNYWVVGGHTQHLWWHSRTVALQIKAALEGLLPPAYRDTPSPQVSGQTASGDGFI
ncbi:flavin-containing monooxygenase, partial [Colletotrichum musicola]